MRAATCVENEPAHVENRPALTCSLFLTPARSARRIHRCIDNPLTSNDLPLASRRRLTYKFRMIHGARSPRTLTHFRKKPTAVLSGLL